MEIIKIMYLIELSNLYNTAIEAGLQTHNHYLLAICLNRCIGQGFCDQRDNSAKKETTFTSSNTH